MSAQLFPKRGGTHGGKLLTNTTTGAAIFLPDAPIRGGLAGSGGGEAWWSVNSAQNYWTSSRHTSTTFNMFGEQFRVNTAGVVGLTDRAATATGLYVRCVQ